MSRILICLPFFLFFALLYPRSQPSIEPEIPEKSEQKVVRPRAEWFSLLAAGPTAGYPAGLAWTGLYQMLDAPANATEPLPDELNVMAFLEKCLERHEREIRGYKGTLVKQERVQGKTQPNPPEVVKFEFKENPHSVYMKWVEGAFDAAAVVYVKGENQDKMMARPNNKFLSLIVWEEPPNSPKAKRSGRYTIDEFGIKIGLERVLKTWRQRQADNELHVQYEGVFFVDKAGNRPCYKIHRTKFERPEDDGVFDVIVYIDTETWLQVGSILRDQKGQLIGEYFFRDLQLNPEFPPGYFNREMLKKS